MIRVVFDFETPTWTKWGVVVFAADEDSVAAAIREESGEGADVAIREQRQATDAEVALMERSKAWQLKWRQAAANGSAGRLL